MGSEGVGGTGAGAGLLGRLDRARADLLTVHRALLHAEREQFERVHGRIANNSAFLQLVIEDAWFAWLRPMAQLVLLIDERTSDKNDVLGDAEAKGLLDRAVRLLRPDADGDDFQQRYARAVDQSPDLAFLAAKVKTAWKYEE